MKPTPEPVHFNIGPFPLKPPVVVKFIIPEAEPIPGKTNPYSPEFIAAEMRHRELKKCKLHFGNNSFLLTDAGILEPIQEDTVPAIPEISLDIDFSWFQTGHASRRLPDQLGLIEKLVSGYSCDPWRLVLSRKEDPEWHDFIMFQDRSFIIHSIFWAVHTVETRIVKKVG